MSAKQIYQHYAEQERPFVKMVVSSLKDVTHNQKVKRFDFLTKREQDIVISIIGTQTNLAAGGGFTEAERMRMTLSPFALSKEEKDITILEVSWNPKFAALRHPDILGALLSLGIERKLIGDIRCTKKTAQIAVCDRIADFIVGELKVIARASVCIEKSKTTEIEQVEEVEQFTLLTKSLRLDIVLSQLLHASRSHIQNLLSKDIVQINWKLVHSGAIQLNVADILSIRRAGRFELKEIMATKNNTKYKISIEKKI
ncbi:hypothetical protein AwErysi_00640 [Erysipelotrichaceae bacterium]|nr:hypothetical protein AwErysi_00640 [Erysipelotrichaceae bacterium]